MKTDEVDVTRYKTWLTELVQVLTGKTLAWRGRRMRWRRDETTVKFRLMKEYLQKTTPEKRRKKNWVRRARAMDLSKEVPFGSLERLLTRWKRERIRISPTTGVSSRTTSKCARARAIVEPFLAKNRSKAQTMLICKRAVHTDCLGLQTTDPHHQSFFSVHVD